MCLYRLVFKVNENLKNGRQLILEQHKCEGLCVGFFFNKYVLHNLRLVESAGAELCIQRTNCKVTGVFSIIQRVVVLKSQCCSRVDCNFIQI